MAQTKKRRKPVPATTRSFALEKRLQELPQRNLTVLLLRSLDLVAPGQWDNPRDFNRMLRRQSGERSSRRLRAVRDVAHRLWTDQGAGYQRALQVYRLVDTGDRLIGAASLASKVGERVEMLRFLRRVSPKTDTLQAIDLVVKLGAEAVAFGMLHGRDQKSLADLGKAFATYTGENSLRVSTLVCVDGLIPLGPEFADRAKELAGRVKRSDLAHSKVFQKTKELFPGRSDTARFGAAGEALESAGTWLSSFADRFSLTPSDVAQRVGRVVRGADSKLDVLAAFLDVSTNYFSHTGTQTVARALIDDAIAEAPREIVPRRQQGPPAGLAELRAKQRREAETLRLRQKQEQLDLERAHREQERRRSQGLWDEGAGVG